MTSSAAKQEAPLKGKSCAVAPSETNHFVFDMASPILCRDDDDRIPVLRTILPALEKRRFASLTFRNIRLQVMGPDPARAGV